MVEDGAEGLEALSAELFPKTGRATALGRVIALVARAASVPGVVAAAE